MEYIDKGQNSVEAHALLDDFLREVRNADGSYPSDLYGALDNAYRQRLVDILMRENDNRCCYCMRKIPHDNVSNRLLVTLEHVITRNCPSQEEYDRYTRLPSDWVGRDLMMWAKDFRDGATSALYPHTIAYENLIPSCDGKFVDGTSALSCNLLRKEKFLFPLCFRRQIHDEVKYYTDGSVEWSETDLDSIIPSVNILGLNCELLRTIRLIWYYIASHHLDLANVNREEVIYDLLCNFEELDQMLLNFKKDRYWNLLSEYAYFNDVNKFRALPE